MTGVSLAYPKRDKQTADPPLVSAITIFLNAERFIEEAIESVLGQTYQRWELLLVDDGSSDASTRIAQRYAAQRPGHIRYLEHPAHENRGMSATRNLGIARSRGKYVAFLDADDVWLPTRLARHVEQLERDPELAAVYSATRYWYSWTGRAEDAERDFTGDPLVETERRYEPPELLLKYLQTRGGATTCPTNLTVRRAAAIEVNGFEERFRGLSEDQAFLAKLRLTRPLLVLGECLALYRQHPGSCTEHALTAGHYHPKRPNPIQRAYLDWLEGYLDALGMQDRRVRRALRKLMIPYRNPRLYPIVNFPHRVRDGADFARRLLRSQARPPQRSGNKGAPDHGRLNLTASAREQFERHELPEEDPAAVCPALTAALPNGGGAWAARQYEMCLWYDSLLVDKKAAIDHLSADYQPFADLLYSFAGRILDIGGGSGFARRFTRRDSEYICIDPSEAWLRPEWATITGRCGRTAFVLGVGEFLPFRQNTFDGALAMWSLNHVCEPESVFKEVSRVLKPGARWLVVFEDIEPTWLDAARSMALGLIGMEGSLIQLEAPGHEIAKRKLIKRLRHQDWPLQRDHLRIRERDILIWCQGRFRRTRRRWIGGYLAYQLVNLPKASGPL